MKDIYRVTRGQAIAVFVFGAITTVFLFGMAVESNDPFLFIVDMVIGFSTVFYTIGWRSHNLKDS